MIFGLVAAPLWIASAPLYDKALASALNVSLYITEPADMGHRITIDRDIISIDRWIFGVAPHRLNNSGLSISFSGVILLALMLASPLSFDKRFAAYLIISLSALFVFHVFVLWATSVNPFPLYPSPYPSAILPYFERLSPIERNFTGTLTKSLHAFGWAFAPVIIWIGITKRKCF